MVENRAFWQPIRIENFVSIVMTNRKINFSVCKGLMFKGLLCHTTVTFHTLIAVVMLMNLLSGKEIVNYWHFKNL